MKAGPRGAAVGVAMARGRRRSARHGRARSRRRPGLHVAAFQAPASLEQGARAEISGRVSPAASVPVAVERLEGGSWTTAGHPHSSKKGRFSARLPLARTSNLRVSVQLADGTVSSSRRRSIALRRRISLQVAAAPLENIAGRPFTVRGAVRPAATGEKVALQGSVDGKPFRTITTLRVRVREGRRPVHAPLGRFLALPRSPSIRPRAATWAAPPPPRP